MSTFVVRGGNTLSGEVAISGAKNAAAAVIPATLLTTEDCIIHNVPKIQDVEKLLLLIERMGGVVKWEGEHTVVVNTSAVEPANIDYDLMSEIRMSIVLTGPLVARFGEVKFVKPGGCAIGARPINTHLSALESLGVTVEQDDCYFYLQSDGDLTGDVVLHEMSVTATENTLLALSYENGVSSLQLAASEPHVTDLISVLEKMGVSVSGKGSHSLSINSSGNLKGFEHSLIPDTIEMGTYMVAGALGSGVVTLINADPKLIAAEINHFERAGVSLELGDDYIAVNGESSQLCGLGKVQSLPHPGFSSDLLAPFALLMTQAEGSTLIHETLFESRIQNYIPQLADMGADAHICDPHRALIHGKTDLYGTSVISADLRAGATLILAALIAEGESEISRIEQIDRGYVSIDEKLRELGADIRRVD